MQLHSFTKFRALAIIFIVAGHSYSTVGIRFDSFLDSFIKNFIAGGTCLFVFISGFLFHHVFFKRFDYQLFLKNKCKNILFPYFFLGFLPICYYIFLKKNAFDGAFYFGDGFWNSYVIPTLKYYSTGRFFIAYWYVPFIILTFVLSPLHIKFIKITFKYKILIILSLSLLSIFMHRPINNVNVFQSLIYFTPIYLIGISASIHKDLIYKKLYKMEGFLLLSVFALVLLQSYLGYEGSYHKHAFAFNGIDIVFIQKIILCFFFMVYFHNKEIEPSRLTSFIADTSFAVYFMHPFVILFIFKLNLMKFDSWFFLFIFAFSLAVLCAFIAKLVKKVLNKKSRIFIGY